MIKYTPLHIRMVHSRRAVRGLRAAVACGVFCAGALVPGCRCGSREAGPKAPYAELVSLFTTAAIGLQVGDKSDSTPAVLKKFTELAPEEPAGWANLGLYELNNNQLEEAVQHVDKARDLAPNNGGIESLLAVIADRQGHLDTSIQHWQAAVRLEPNNLRSRYSLAQQLLRENTAEGDSGNQQELLSILDIQPSNILANLDLATIAAKRADKPSFAKALQLLQAHAPSFTSAQAAEFSEIKKGENGDIRQLSIPSRLLLNLLKGTSAYKSSYPALVLDPREGLAEPILQFIKLPAIPSTPDPPDMQTKFTPAPLNIPGTTLWTIWLDDTGKQITASGSDLSVSLPGNVSLPFPGAAAKQIPVCGVLPLDVNYDFLMDLFFAGPGGIKLYIQDKNGRFTDATASMKLPEQILKGSYYGAWAMDVDADGDLDIILGCTTGESIVLQNNGDGTWQPIHTFKGVDGLRAFCLADVEGTGNPDVAMIDSQRKLHVFSNERGGVFIERPVPASLGPVRAVAAGDLDAGSNISFIALNAAGEIFRLSDKSHGTDWDVNLIASWTEAADDRNGPAQLLVADLDNNGGLDLVASTSKHARVWLTGSDYKLTPPASQPPGPVFALATPASGGRPDLIGLDLAGSAIRLVNSGEKAYHWQDIRERANDDERSLHKADHRVNSFGVGGEMEARAGLLYEKMQMGSPSLHFGLGSYKALDAIRMIWPNGDLRAEFASKLKADSSVGLQRRLDISCPYLFAWNGKQMQFITDCIWRSPLGLKINAQDTAGVSMTQDWVKIAGDQLVPDSKNEYDLRITAELWETHFFDHLSMLAIDHPEGTEMFVDERFSVPPPPLKPYLMTALRPVRRATDDLGNDVTQTVRARDGVYLDTFGRGDYQGVTRDHYVEIDPGESSPGAGPQYLVCNGFIYPTNSSVNLAIGQGHTPAPRGLQLETPDAAGRWTVARPGLGFPEGKVKTILIDLTGVFKPGAPRKLRLRTNLEIYWDSIQVANGLPDRGMKIQHLDAASATLGYRGFSVIKSANGSSPDLPQSYDRLETSRPKWRDLEGFCTRYGDVKELLRSIDDRYVIMSPGDELRLKFKAPPAPAAGYRRDYVLIGDGWVKDGDYNTTFSRTVLPLPQHANSTYNVRPTTLEADPVYRVHRRDWQVYHTRYVWPYDIGSRLRPGD